MTTWEGLPMRRIYEMTTWDGMPQMAAISGKTTWDGMQLMALFWNDNLGWVAIVAKTMERQPGLSGVHRRL
eukprot:3852553-Amphidinium_carterae.1